MIERLQLKLHQHMTFEDAVIKDQVNEIVGSSNENALLAGLETKPVSKFQHEFLQSVQKLIFQLGIAHYLAGLQTKKLKHKGIVDIQSRFRLFRSAVGQFGEFFSCLLTDLSVRNRDWRSAVSIAWLTSCSIPFYGFHPLLAIRNCFSAIKPVEVKF